MQLQHLDRVCTSRSAGLDSIPRLFACEDCLITGDRTRVSIAQGILALCWDLRREVLQFLFFGSIRLSLLKLPPSLERNLASVLPMQPTKCDVPAEHYECGGESHPEHWMLAGLLASSVDGQYRDQRSSHDDAPERRATFVQERIHDLLERKHLSLLCVGGIAIGFRVFAGEGNVRVDGLLPLFLFREFMHPDRGWDELRISEDNVQQERE